MESKGLGLLMHLGLGTIRFNLGVPKGKWVLLVSGDKGTLVGCSGKPSTGEGLDLPLIWPYKRLRVIPCR